MSTRTVIEINHDHLADLVRSPERLIQYLRDLQGSGKPEFLPGVRLLGQRHHSETLKLTVK